MARLVSQFIDWTDCFLHFERLARLQQAVMSIVAARPKSSTR